MTTDPKRARSLIPIGGYKGYGLSAMVEILCSIMTGMNFGKKIPPMFSYDIKKTRNLGQYFMVFKTDLFSSNSIIFNNLEKMYNEIYKLPSLKSTPKVFLPNDKEIFILNERKKTGIPITQNIDDFTEINNQIKIENIFLMKIKFY